MAERVSIYGPDAVAALLVRHANAFVREGVRRLGDYGNFSRREVVEEVIHHLNAEITAMESLILARPSELHWQDELAAFLAIVAFLRTQLPVEPATTETEAKP